MRSVEKTIRIVSRRKLIFQKQLCFDKDRFSAYLKREPGLLV